MASLIARKLELNGAGSGNSKSELEQYLAEDKTLGGNICLMQLPHVEDHHMLQNHGAPKYRSFSSMLYQLTRYTPPLCLVWIGQAWRGLEPKARLRGKETHSGEVPT